MALGSEYALQHRGDDTEGMGDAQLLATILEWAGQPPLESQEMAHILLEDFGDLRSVLIDSPKLPQRYPSIGLNEAALLRLYLDLMGRYLVDAARPIQRPRSIVAAYQLFLPRFYDQTVELVCAIFLDRQGYTIALETAPPGEADSISLPSTWVLERAAQLGAKGVLLAHNHPDGLGIFSHSDVRSTLKLAWQLDTMGVRLVDHYLLADLQIFSLRLQLRLDEDAPWPPPESLR